MNKFEQPFSGQEQKDAKAESWQQLERITSEMAAKSYYNRTTESKTIDKIAPKDPENKRFAEIGELKIEHIKDPESRKVEALVDFMNKFEPEEADTPEIIRDAIANETEAYAYHIIEDKDGKVAAHIQSSLLELAPANENDKPSQTIIFNGFVITADDFQRKGLATELYQTMMRCNLEKAKAKEQEVKAVVVEGKENSEPFWNHVGLRRIYFEDAEGNFHEVPYIQPPIDWNKKTGTPSGWKKGDDFKKFSMPEHLMIRRVDDKQEITMDELRPMLEIIYSDNYTLYRNKGERYPTDKAIAKTQEIIEGFQQELEDAVSRSKDGKLYLFNAKEREQKMAEVKAAGKNLEHFVFAKETK